MSGPCDLARFRGRPFFLDDEALSWVRGTLEQLSLHGMIAQLLIPEGPPAFGAGGVFVRCAEPMDQLRTETAAAAELPGIPLLVAADIEFAAQGRLIGGTEYPCQMAVGAAGDSAAARRMGAIAGSEGRAAGIHWTFSPVVDLAYNHRSPGVNTRSFGAQAGPAAELVAAYVEGVQAEGMAATLKHWPGDGDDERDQHFTTTRNGLSVEKWRDTFGRTFGAGIRAGAKTVMSAHIAFPAYLQERGELAATLLPASLSRALNIDLLRTELGFDGLIVSDGMVMGGATSVLPWEELGPAMVAAGCDMVLFPPPIPEASAYFERALRLGTLPEERLREAAARVLALKASLGLHRNDRGGKSAAQPPVKTAEHESWAQDCAERSITLVKDVQGLLPLNIERTPRVLLFLSRPDEFQGPPYPFILDRLLEERGFEVSIHHAGSMIDIDLFDLLLYVVEEQPMFTVPSLRIKWSRFGTSRQASMRRRWHEIPTVFVSLGNPFHPYEIPACPTIVNAYSACGPSQRALAAALVGEIPFIGDSPIDPFCGCMDEAGRIRVQSSAP